ncbi:purine permease 10 [Prunus dulcis]|uniref:Purine permease 10 n=1 Tax=Prunus dulcis TaxID=3755 RepID=A0A4Y1RPD0_PRUDU|nr:purine permease 10 [Prunus dulcis]
MVKEAEEDNTLGFKQITHQATISHFRDFTVFVLSGQSAAIFLGRLYCNRGGKSIWMATLVQFIGFPILIPYHCILSSKNIDTDSNVNQPDASALALRYRSFGVPLAADSLLYSIGLLYLPFSTFSLTLLVLLTISFNLLVFHPNSVNLTRISQQKYTVRVTCTVAASAGYNSMFSLTQFSFTKVLKSQTFVSVLEMIIYQLLTANCATLVGLFVSEERQGLQGEGRV